MSRPQCPWPWSLLALSKGKSWDLIKAVISLHLVFMFPKGAQDNHFVFKVNARRAICKMDCTWRGITDRQASVGQSTPRDLHGPTRSCLLGEAFLCSLGSESDSAASTESISGASHGAWCSQVHYLFKSRPHSCLQDRRSHLSLTDENTQGHC